MPYKFNDPRRHKFKKARYKVTNWTAYNAALKSRGNLTIWFTPEVIHQWYYKPPKMKTRGRQYIYSNLAILTALTLKAIFKQALRQTEGLIESIVNLMQLDLQVPDFSTFSRRTESLDIPKLSTMLNANEIINIVIDSTGLKVYGPGEWHQCKYSIKQRKNWRKLHIAVDINTQKIVASELTTHDIGDPTPVPELLKHINQKFASVTADGAYDNASVYEAIERSHARAIIPPHANATLSKEPTGNLSTRERHLLNIFLEGRLKWQKETGYNLRSLVETAMYRYKQIIGDDLRCKKISNQKIESKIGCTVLNKMVDLGMPNSFKIAV
jgi:hypothetical protein